MNGNTSETPSHIMNFKMNTLLFRSMLYFKAPLLHEIHLKKFEISICMHFSIPLELRQF